MLACVSSCVAFVHGVTGAADNRVHDQSAGRKSHAVLSLGAGIPGVVGSAKATARLMLESET